MRGVLGLTTYKLPSHKWSNFTLSTILATPCFFRSHCTLRKTQKPTSSPRPCASDGCCRVRAAYWTWCRVHFHFPRARLWKDVQEHCALIHFSFLTFSLLFLITGRVEIHAALTKRMPLWSSCTLPMSVKSRNHGTPVCVEYSYWGKEPEMEEICSDSSLH